MSRACGLRHNLRMDARSLAMPVDPAALAVTANAARISPRVWRVVAPNPSALTGPGTNTYLVGGDRPLVIDPGVHDEAHLERILAIAGGAIESVVCTHSHPDHSPGAAELRTRTGASIVGIERSGANIINPGPDEELQSGDQVLLLGTKDQLNAARTSIQPLPESK